jgi:hypothetical protein
MTSKIDKDYLVIGAGAMAMAYHLVSEPMRPSSLLQDVSTRRASDNRLPLHQACAVGGVNSQPFGGGAINCTGWNMDCVQHSAGDEICA